MNSIFIDGRCGTTGLRIAQRLSGRKDLEILTLPEAQRRDVQARRAMLNACDVAILCLPDAAAREAVAMVENPRVRILDSSTAHRTAPGWTYGFPELSQALREEILQSRRIAVPGCHASGFIALTAPLVAAGILPRDALLSCHSVTGYSGGGKQMIAAYEVDVRSPMLNAPRQYGLGQGHKHLSEMQKISGLEHAPLFCPIVSDFYSGMMVTVPLFRSQLAGGADVQVIEEIYRATYPGPVVRWAELSSEGFLSANAAADTDRMNVYVYGNGERILLTACYDNLGKGASGASVQLLNLILGAQETEGLEGI